MDLGLKGKHAIVTGGSQGIGKAIARELAREGVDVAIVARKKEQLEAVALELSAETGGRVIALPADVTSTEQVEAMVAEADRQLGGLHILVNSGSSPGGSASAIGPIETVNEDDLIHDFNVKYVGASALLACRHPASEETGLGTHHQRKRNERAQCRKPERRRAQRFTRALHENARGSTRPVRDHGELHTPRHDAHRAHAASHGRPRRRAGHHAGGSRDSATTPPIRRGETRSAGWSMHRRSRTSPRFSRRTSRGRSAGSWWSRPGERANPFTTRAKNGSVPFFPKVGLSHLL